MKTISILSLKLEHFKCHKALTMTFDGKSRTIYGDNAAGKTSVYDGLTWLLFGKTSSGSSDNELLKPVGADGHVLDHSAITAVEAVLLVTDTTPSVSSADSSPAEQGSLARTVTDTAPSVSSADSSPAKQGSQIPRQPSADTPFSKGDKYGAYGNDVGDTTPSVSCADSFPAEQGSLVRTVTLRRELQEVWTSRRGCAEQVLDGNTSAYYIDGVPMKKNEYDRRVAELVDETAFRLLTSVFFFAETMPWKDRRAVLAELCGSMTDTQLMYEDERFTGLIEKIGTGSLEDYREVLTARKKGLAADRDTIPARISEQEAVIASLAGTDFDALQSEYDLQEATVRDLEAKLNSIKNDSQTEKLQARLSVLSAELDKLYAENRAHRALQEKEKPDLQALQAKIDEITFKKHKAEQSVQNNFELLAKTDDRIERLREEWAKVNAAVFDGERCPACGQRLPKDTIRTARKRFADQRDNELKRIEATAAAAKDSRSAIAAAMEDAKSRASGYEEEINSLQADLEQQKQAAASVVITDMEGYGECKAAIEAEGKAVRTELSALMSKSGNAVKKAELQLTDARLKAKHLSEQLGCRGALDFAGKRIEELRAQQQEAAKQLEEIDRELFLIEDFVRFKAKRVEERVNGCFRLATFRLFRELVKGGLEECCDAVHDGVPYAALNNGMRINIGLDIIRTLSDHYGVKVPLFIDNAESVTELEDAGTQMIRLVVSAQDKTLRVE